MEIRTYQRPVCLLCVSQGDVLYQELEDYLFGAPGKWLLKRCVNKQCGLCWLDPAAIEADLQYLYTEYYTHDNTAAAAGFQSKLRSILLAVYNSVKLLPLSVLGLTSEKRRFSSLFLDDLAPGRVLDVGCGDGQFLYRMHQAGWSVAGLDFDSKAIDAAKMKYGQHGFELLHSDLADAHFPDNSFDAITMHHVIEHVPKPVAFLAEAKRILKPGGRLVAVTPNAGSLAQSIFQDCWRGWEPPRHLQIFSLPALESCARQATFTRVEVKSSAANADSLIGGCFGIRKAKESKTRARGVYEINILRALRSSLIQYREALLMRRQPDCGEEAVLICHK
ncbi:MAG: class I SAM-dependent methyltransferase [Verrucomicrobiota bacterium]